MTAADDRLPARRRHIAVAGHTGDLPTARAGLDDPDPLVRRTALRAVGRLHGLLIADILRALADPEPTVRRRGVELAPLTASGADGRAAVLEGVRRLLTDPDPLVVVAGCWTLGELISGGDGCGDSTDAGAAGRQTTGSPTAGGPLPAASAVAALTEVAREHADQRCREAAVAALGAIGDPAGLPAVLGGLDDRPAVRRRAAVALAAFDGPEVEPGLRRCLEDRDWQVRQVAEVLLADG